MVPLAGSLHPRAQAQFDAGRVPADTKLNGISIVFSRSTAQQADLNALIAAQQDPASPLFHKWLNPDQFAARFGMAQEDLDKVQSWLEQQGFSIDSVARSKNLIRFSGTVGQVEQAFQTQMHYYKSDGEKNFAPSTELSLPAALAPTVAGIRNLDSFRLHPMHIPGAARRVRPNYTICCDTNNADVVFFAPPDIKKVYNFPTTGTGETGAGQSIAIVGQSSITVSDIEAFQNASSLGVKDPTQVLVPGTGSPVAVAGDESESDIDLEWSSAMAPGANIFFVYTGCSNSTCSNNTYGVFDSIQYAVDEQIGNIISASYGACETSVSSTNFTALDQVLQQATTQGQTVLAASGDQGSTACSGTTGLTTAQQQALAVNYPASSQYATGVGGTEITAANDAVGTYWASATSTTVPALSTALQYIPEVAWNDDAVNGTYSPTNGGGLSASGGGVSTFYTSKPSWQKGVTGIPNDNKRDVPDIALYASPNYPGYLYCSSDQSVWSPAGNGSSAQQGSCTNGFLDSTGGYLTIAGGTSFAAPIFAGMLAIINQEAGYTAGQGNVNPSLYTLASNAATYAAAFHDVTSGNNYCTAGTTYGYCSSGGATEGYAAGTGYDLVTGLGSVNLDVLAPAWMTNAAPLVGTTTSVSASNSTPNSGQSVTFTISVASNTGSTTPTGNVTLQIDGGTAWGAGGTTVAAQPLSNNGTLTYTTSSFTTAGVHQVLAQYAGDATHAASTGVAQVTIAGTSSGAGSFTLTATAVTVSQGSAGPSTITVKPAGGYTGTVLLNIAGTSNDTALNNLCYSFATSDTSGDGIVTVTSASSVTTTLTLDTNAADCVTAAVSKPGQHAMHSLRRANTSKNDGPNPAAPATIAFAGLLLAGFLGRYSRKFRNLAGLVALLAVGLAVSACGGGVTSNTPTNPPKGSYTITLAGVDSTTSTITGSTTFTFIIQ
jgi:subtilase family serine protease